MKLKDLSNDLRPRERFIRFGCDALSNSELLALVLQSGTYNTNVLDLSNNILSEYSLDKLSELSIKELQGIRGIGLVKAMQIRSVFEINKRLNQQRKNVSIIKNAKDVYNYLSDELLKKKQEYFYTLLLNSRNEIIKKELVSIGILNASLIHPREVFKAAIKESANAIILVHNHPSGDPNASEEDIMVTKELVTAGEVIGIKVLDHVIVYDGGYSNIICK